VRSQRPRKFPNNHKSSYTTTKGLRLTRFGHVQAFTVTANSATYRVSTTAVTKTLGRVVSATLQEQCDLQGTTQAVCAATLGGTVEGHSTTDSTTMTLSGTDYYRYDVAITGGAEKTATATAQCKAPTPSGNAGASTKAVAMWGLVVGAAGVASLLAF
jgi:hypothetical protein